MTKFANAFFQTPANSKAYVDNWEQVFGKSKKTPIKKTAKTQKPEGSKQTGVSKKAKISQKTPDAETAEACSENA